jgi:hypothetical protein
MLYVLLYERILVVKCAHTEVAASEAMFWLRSVHAQHDHLLVVLGAQEWLTRDTIGHSPSQPGASSALRVAEERSLNSSPCASRHHHPHYTACAVEATVLQRDETCRVAAKPHHPEQASGSALCDKAWHDKAPDKA